METVSRERGGGNWGMPQNNIEWGMVRLEMGKAGNGKGWKWERLEMGKAGNGKGWKWERLKNWF